MIHMIGNAHIDPVWFWHWQEGVQEVLATFRSALDRIGETPNFIFTAACACYYKWVEEIDPNMFREIQERVRPPANPSPGSCFGASAISARNSA